MFFLRFVSWSFIFISFLVFFFMPHIRILGKLINVNIWIANFSAIINFFAFTFCTAQFRACSTLHAESMVWVKRYVKIRQHQLTMIYSCCDFIIIVFQWCRKCVCVFFNTVLGVRKDIQICNLLLVVFFSFILSVGFSLVFMLFAHEIICQVKRVLFLPLVCCHFQLIFL